MNRTTFRRWLNAAGALLAFGPAADAVRACAICSGDPESPMAQGAAAGVLALVIIVGGVLAGIAGITGFWIVRARRLARRESAGVSSPSE